MEPSLEWLMAFNYLPFLLFLRDKVIPQFLIINADPINSYMIRLGLGPKTPILFNYDPTIR